MTRCSDVMTREPVSCESGDPISRVAEIMKSEDVGSVPVVESAASKRLVGIVTDRDIILRLLAEGRVVATSSVRDAMTPTPATCREDDDVSRAVARMTEKRVRRLPVVDSEGRLTGIIAQADIATRVRREKTTADMVEAISAPAAVRP